jgi:hypothetical protein
MPNRVFKDMHKGERLFILGSGPSIKEQDLKRLEGEIVMTQNNFHVHEDVPVFKPRYHVVIPKHQPKDFDGDWMEWFRLMEEKLPDDCRYFMGANTKYLIDQTGLRDKTYYVKTGMNPLFMNRGTVDLTKRIMNVPTATTMCLSVALYMGFSEIYMLGFDMDQIVRLTDNKVGRFYSESPITKNESEQSIHEKLVRDGQVFFNRWVTMKQLNLLRGYAEKRNIQITNLTIGGLLTTFDRANYEDIVQ